jgi:hypothetical protein
MSLFSGENPNLGTNTTFSGNKEISTRVLFLPLIATSASQIIYIAPSVSGDKWQLDSVSSIFGTASTSGTVQVEYLTGTAASGTGTALLATPLALSGTANTTAFVKPSVVKTLNPGDRLGLVLAGTLTGLAGGFLQISLKKV